MRLARTARIALLTVTAVLGAAGGLRTTSSSIREPRLGSIAEQRVRCWSGRRRLGKQIGGPRQRVRPLWSPAILVAGGVCGFVLVGLFAFLGLASEFETLTQAAHAA
ncbi:hypothetical protein DQ239_08805 [Blastococcus sp. TF02-09]|nr:hypothetical protein DQ239_08805 [Blastococcus sp. TF02-9]